MIFVLLQALHSVLIALRVLLMEWHVIRPEMIQYAQSLLAILWIVVLYLDVIILKGILEFTISYLAPLMK